MMVDEGASGASHPIPVDGMWCVDNDALSALVIEGGAREIRKPARHLTSVCITATQSETVNGIQTAWHVTHCGYVAIC